MSESDLYQLWESRAETGAAFYCAGGERVVVISPGRRNPGSGPDYLDAVLLVDGVLEVGAVEMHLRESDWFAHRHEDDPAYQGVRLHLLAVPQHRLRLSIPTMFARDLHAAAPAEIPERDLPDAIDPALLAELSWGRLLRRAIAIIRSEPGCSEPDRLRRAFIRRLFDCLGYSRNREGMATVAELLMLDEPALARVSFDHLAARVFAASGLPFERVARAGAPLMSEERLRAVRDAELPRQNPVWRYDTRPAGTPERRLWGAVRLLYDIYHGGLLLRLHEAAVEGAFDRGARMLVVSVGGSTFVGMSRARGIVMNALIPVALAAGAIGGSREVLEGICLLYREAPSLESNRIVRDLEDRYLRGFALGGGFWQQGAIELYQRYHSPDRSALSFIAERGEGESR